MAKYRYGSPHGKPEKSRVCECGDRFEHKYDCVVKCLECRKEYRRAKRRKVKPFTMEVTSTLRKMVFKQDEKIDTIEVQEEDNSGGINWQ